MENLVYWRARTVKPCKQRILMVGPSVEEHLTTFAAPGYVGNFQRKRNPSMNGNI